MHKMISNTVSYSLVTFMSHELEVRTISGYYDFEFEQISAFELEICYFLEIVFDIWRGVGSEKD